jgi:[protein-PII] uridylyltransferase
VPTRAHVTQDTSKNISVLEVISPDRPGLLARLGTVFVDFGIEVQTAKIQTLGERVEDLFFITDSQQQPITSPEHCEAIEVAIRNALDSQIKSAQ